MLIIFPFEISSSICELLIDSSYRCGLSYLPSFLFPNLLELILINTLSLLTPLYRPRELRRSELLGNMVGSVLFHIVLINYISSALVSHDLNLNSPQRSLFV